MDWAKITIVHHTPTGRWHPMYFKYKPLPGGGLPGPLGRYKSGGHHTVGFETEADAEAFLPGMTEDLKDHFPTIGRIPNLVNDDPDADFVMVSFFPLEGAGEEALDVAR